MSNTRYVVKDSNLSNVILVTSSIKGEGKTLTALNLSLSFATLNVFYDSELVGEYDLLSYKSVKKVNFFSKIMRSLNYLIWGDV